MPENNDIFEKLAEPMEHQRRAKTFYPKGKAGTLEPGTKGQFLAYIDARDVAKRLDEVVGAECWQDSFEIVNDQRAVIKAGLGLKIDDAWIWKYDYGYPNSDQDEEPLKSSSSDAFKRAAVKWGIGRFLYDLEPEWLEVDKWGKPLDSATSRPAPAMTTAPQRQVDTQTGEIVEPTPAASSVTPSCPVCSGAMWDNRADKRNPKAPDFKCKDKTCDGAIWPPKDGHPREDDGYQSLTAEEEVKQAFGGSSAPRPFDEMPPEDDYTA